MPDTHGDYVWYELMTSDADAAQAFYEPLVGWSFAVGNAPGVDYRIGSKAGVDVVGLMQLTGDMTKGGARPAWVGYIAVDDIEATIPALKDKGGQVFMGPHHLENVGYMAMVADPQGAPFYLLQPEGEGSQSFAKHKPREGHCAWNELASSDQDAAKVFYGDMFGWVQEGEMEMGPMGTYEFLRHTDYGIGAVMPLMPGMPASAWSYYFRVPDIDRAASAISDTGGRLILEPVEIPGGDYSLMASDPQGATFGLVGPRN